MIKVVVIGSVGTGKTNITTRFIKDKYRDSCGSTVGVEFLSKVLDIKGEQIKATVWDTAGQ